jgi:hypothetical protein
MRARNGNDCCDYAMQIRRIPLWQFSNLPAGTGNQPGERANVDSIEEIASAAIAHSDRNAPSVETIHFVGVGAVHTTRPELRCAGGVVAIETNVIVGMGS